MAVLDSLIIAVLWFFLGFTGIHLFVAGRRTEGFLWLGSGGVFGFGYLGDLGRLHLLIREYRGDPRAFAPCCGQTASPRRRCHDGPLPSAPYRSRWVPCHRA